MDAIPVGVLRPDLERAAAGGEGVVYRIKSESKTVYKEYKADQRHQINAEALTDLIQAPSTWPAEQRDRLSRRTTWPLRAVVDGSGVCGFVMAAIEERFYVRHGLRANPKRVLCDWNQLAYQQQAPLASHLMSEVPLLSTDMVLRLISDLVTTVDALHKHGIIIGDMSGKNLIWNSAAFEVLVIDCDSFRLDGRRGICAHKETPGWVDPTLQGRPTSMESDIYKLGVAAYRALYHDPTNVVTSDLVKHSVDLGLPTSLVSTLISSVGIGARPTAADWAAVFSTMFKYGGRRVIAVQETSSARPGADDSVAVQRVRPRLPVRGASP